MKICVFPGQGSQTVGMGKDLYENFASAKAVFDEVDNALNQNLSKIIFEGPIEELTLTANTQPALMATSIAMMQVLEKEYGLGITKIANFVAGHSLGEYTALCAAFSITLSDTAKLLSIRGNAMQKAVPIGQGAMAAILGASEEELAQIVTAGRTVGVCDVANDNAPGQVVISGHAEAIEKAMEFAASISKKAIKLSVSAPFHSKLMENAAKVMEEALAEVEVKAPKLPLIANVTCLPTIDPTEIRHNLVTQVAGQVQWRKSMQYIYSQNVGTQIEVGPGRILNGMTKRINKEIITLNISNLEDLKNFAANFS